ncbi:hypothetical protein NE237_003264 [Protea cynaroides]|uniref:Cathepsin propeptide inhibitor domain-containing protein n=1 Tax=Protea cynaroides TaxID=273540 RepID=A0A9Q0QS99_9MAGN|nr:hypothetical protein NE237_003264 [Protea cynaroides]
MELEDVTGNQLPWFFIFGFEITKQREDLQNQQKEGRRSKGEVLQKDVVSSVIFFFAATASASDVSADNKSEYLVIRQGVSNVDDLLLEAEHHFDSFKRRFRKTYNTLEEHAYPLGVFKANLQIVRDVTGSLNLCRSWRYSVLRPDAAGVPLESPRNLSWYLPIPILPTNDLPIDFEIRAPLLPLRTSDILIVIPRPSRCLEVFINYLSTVNLAYLTGGLLIRGDWLPYL